MNLMNKMLKIGFSKILLPLLVKLKDFGE